MSSILNPVIYLRGVRHHDIQNIIEFIYIGQVNVAHDDLDSFLAVAEDLCIKGLTQPENTSFCAANTSSSYQPPPAKKSRSSKKPKTSKHILQTKNESHEAMENEFHEDMNVESYADEFYEEVPTFLKSFEPLFTLKDQAGEKLRFICNSCPNIDENGKFVFSKW